MSINLSMGCLKSLAHFSIYLDYCTKDEFKTNDIEKYRGREECACKPIAKCEWTSRLQKLSDKLPSKAPLRKRIVQLMRDSICDYKTKTVHCCKEDGEAGDESEDTSEDYVDDAPRRTLVSFWIHI